MTPQQMATEALAATQAGTRMTMVRMRGKAVPPGFPKGELLGEEHDGRNVYSYDPAKVIAWLNANRLVAIEVFTPNVPVQARRRVSADVDWNRLLGAKLSI